MSIKEWAKRGDAPRNRPRRRPLDLRPRLRIAALDAKYIEGIAFSNVEGGIVNNYGQ